MEHVPMVHVSAGILGQAMIVKRSRLRRKYVPICVLEDFELQCVDIANRGRGHVCVLCPEEVQRKDTPEVDEVRRRPHVVGAELLGVAEAELEQVDGHEGQEGKA